MMSSDGLLTRPIVVGEWLVADPRVCSGTLTFKGTRIPAQTVLTFLAMGDSIERILESWPHLKREAIEEAVRFAVLAWPELMQERFLKPLQRLAEGLKTRDQDHPEAAHEPTHSRRAARRPARLPSAAKVDQGPTIARAATRRTAARRARSRGTSHA